MAITIRTCQPDDLPHVAPMLADLYRNHDQHHETESLPSRLCDFFLVSELDGQLTGFVIGARGPVDVIGREMARDAFLDSPEAPAYLEIQDLYVVPEHRNQGLGSLLMNAVLQRGRAAGLPHSMVYSSNADYARIGRFYERFGYRIDHLFMKQ